MTQLITQGDFLQREGRFWLKADELGKRLGFSNSHDGIYRIYNRNSEELKLFTCIDKLSIQGQIREVRLFDEQGCYIVAMLARTPQAKAFRRALARFLQEIRSREKEYAETFSSLESLKQQVAAMQLKQQLTRFKFSESAGQRLVALKNTGLLSDRELGRVFKISPQNVRKLLKLYRHSAGDFTDRRPEQFKRLTKGVTL